MEEWDGSVCEKGWVDKCDSVCGFVVRECGLILCVSECERDWGD